MKKKDKTSLSYELNDPGLLKVFRWLSQFVWKEDDKREALKYIHYDPRRSEYGAFCATNGRSMGIAYVEMEIPGMPLPGRQCSFLPLKTLKDKTLNESLPKGDIPDLLSVVPADTSGWKSGCGMGFNQLVAWINRNQDSEEGVDIGLLASAVDRKAREHQYSLPYHFAGNISIKKHCPVILDFSDLPKTEKYETPLLIIRKALVMPLREW